MIVFNKRHVFGKDHCGFIENEKYHLFFFDNAGNIAVILEESQMDFSLMEE